METVGILDPSAIQGFLDSLVHIGHRQARHARLESIVDELRLLGIEPGTPVMVAMPNGGPFIALVLALLTHGAVPVLLPPSAPPSRITRIAQSLGADVLVAPRIAPDLRHGDGPHTIQQAAELMVLRGVDRHRYRPGEIVLLTSGTSGVFSGCLHRLDSLLRNAARHAWAIGQTAADRVLINLPMHYSYAFVAQMLATLVSGGKAVIASPPFTPPHYERSIEDNEITLSSLTPAMIESWRLTGRRLPASLRRLTVGGDALAASSVADLLRRNPDLELYLTYGLTEAGPRVSTLAAHLESSRRHGSVGLPLPGVQVHLRPGNPGELVVKTDTGMLRRVGRPDVPAVSCGDSRTAISTGDLFWRDDDGYLFFRDRRPNYVISRGEKVCLRSVCRIAETIPGVRTAEAWTHEDDAGFTLDVYCADADVADEHEIRRQLAKVLLRGEQPAHVLVHPVSHLGWRKSVAK